MYSFRSFQLVESSFPKGARSEEHSKEGTTMHLDHGPDFELDDEHTSRRMMDLYDHVINNRDTHVDLTNKIDGGVSLNTGENIGLKGSKVTVPAGATHAEVKAAYLQKPHMHEPVTNTAREYAQQQRAGKKLAKAQIDYLRRSKFRKSFMGNLIEYEPTEGSHEGKEIITVPTTKHKSEWNLPDKDREELNDLLNQARESQKGNRKNRAHLIDNKGRRHALLSAGGKHGGYDLVRNYMHSTVDTQEPATWQGLHDHVAKHYDEKIASVKTEAKRREYEDKKTKATRHIRDNGRYFDQTFHTHRILTDLNYRLADKIAKQTRKTGRFKFRTWMHHPQFGRLPNHIGEGYVAREKKPPEGPNGLITPKAIKITPRSANGYKIPPRLDFTRTNRLPKPHMQKSV